MGKIVLDASAVLAFLREERGREDVAAVLAVAAISAVNVAEVSAKLMDYGASENSAAEIAGQLGLKVVPFDAGSARLSAAMRPATRSAGLSLGDRACLALALELGAVAWTADRAWGQLDSGVEVKLIR